MATRQGVFMLFIFYYPYPPPSQVLPLAPARIGIAQLRLENFKTFYSFSLPAPFGPLFVFTTLQRRFLYLDRYRREGRAANTIHFVCASRS